MDLAPQFHPVQVTAQKCRAQRFTVSVYRPPTRLELYAVAAARERILQRLAERPEGGPLDRFLPDPVVMEDESRPRLRQRSAWSSTFVAGLELAKLGEVRMDQEGAFQSIHVVRM
jgi:chromatin segregation and condensation protein Rec8/ScpA/Scc1 (kleisin family)